MFSNAVSFHAPSERLSGDELKDQVLLFENNELLKQAYNATNNLIIILNEFRQIVFVNEMFLKSTGMWSADCIIGKRPGEAINCIHCNDNLGGCGTSEACRYCNGVNLVLKSISNHSANSGEFVITTKRNGIELPMNLLENVTPISFNEKSFYVVALTDISDSKRREVLERTFFHDIINTSGGLRGLISLLKSDVPESLAGEVEFIEESFSGLIDDIVEQKQILDAENEELALNASNINSEEIINHIVKVYRSHDAAKNKEIIISKDIENISFKIDLILLKRVLGNMIKNALESAQSGEAIIIGCNVKEEDIEFWVHNNAFIPRDVQVKIFQRSFSTKGNGRGLGTYSMKLFGERFLKGKVSFITDEKSGTTFYIKLKNEM